MESYGRDSDRSSRYTEVNDDRGRLLEDDSHFWKYYFQIHHLHFFVFCRSYRIPWQSFMIRFGRSMCRYHHHGPHKLLWSVPSTTGSLWSMSHLAEKQKAIWNNYMKCQTTPKVWLLLSTNFLFHLYLLSLHSFFSLDEKRLPTAKEFLSKLSQLVNTVDTKKHSKLVRETTKELNVTFAPIVINWMFVECTNTDFWWLTASRKKIWG